MAISAQPINTIDQARALALTLSHRYTFETQAVFGSGRVIGFIVRLLKKDHRGVIVGQAILRNEDAQDFVNAHQAAKCDGQVQRLIKAWFAGVVA